MLPPDDQILDDVNRWLETMVLGLELWPFAPKVVTSGALTVRLCVNSGTADVLAELHEAVLQLLNIGGDATMLMVLPAGFEHFDDYLDLLSMAQALLEMQQLDSAIQLASFHPDYVFEGATEEDVSNYSNRSPYPIIHLLQEESVSRAVDHYPDVEAIAERNIKRLEGLGLAVVKDIYRRTKCRTTSSGA